MQALGLVWGELDISAPDYRERFVTLDAPKHSGAKLMLDVWANCRRHGGMIVGRDLPSRAVSSVLRNLAVYEPIENGGDWTVRIAGTAFYRRFGRDVTGARFSDLFEPDIFESNRRLLEQVVAEHAPAVREVERVQGSRTAIRFELLLLPVRSPDRKADWIAAGLFFHDWVR